MVIFARSVLFALVVFFILNLNILKMQPELSTSSSIKRFAVLRLHLPDGTLLKRQVVEESEGRFLRHYPLTEETPNTVWLRGDYFVSGVE